jgi:hypothetical protein
LYSENPKERDNLEDQGVDKGKVLKWIEGVKMGEGSFGGFL